MDYFVHVSRKSITTGISVVFVAPDVACVING